MLKDNLNYYLNKNGDTMYKVSQETGLSLSYLYALKSGEMDNPSIDTLNTIAFYFNCKLTDLV